MYIPKHFKQEDKAKLIKFMREFNFAVLVSAKNGKPVGTHLPFLIDEKNGSILLKAHMAKANPQWKEFSEDREVLVIFQEPHAYISPSLYEHKLNVPTWNYIAVHAYGLPEINKSDEQNIVLLESSFSVFESSFKKQWDELPQDYRSKLLKGIVGFEIRVTKLEGKFKLSQNKTENERDKVADSLLKSSGPAKKALGELMLENNKSIKGKMIKEDDSTPLN